MSLGSRVNDLRVAKNDSLQKTADAVGTSKAHIWQIERGKALNPSIGLLKNLASYFKVTVSYLVGEDLDAPDADRELASMFRDASEFTDSEREILLGMMKTLKESSDKRKLAD